MKLLSKKAAISLLEVIITVGVITVAGAGIFEILRTGVVLFGKNSSMNLSHNQARFGLLQLQQDMASAVSTADLTDTAGNILQSGTAVGPAPGVTFQVYAGGPFCLYAGNATAASSTTQTILATATAVPVVTGTGFKPLSGEIICIQAQPMLNSVVTGTISSVGNSTTTSGTTYYTPTLSGSLGTPIPIWDTVASQQLSVACYFTAPVRYVVQNGTLMRYTLDPSSSGSMTGVALAYNISSSGTAPFYVPAVNSSNQGAFLQAQNFSAYDPSSNNRGYKGVTTPFTALFSQLATQY